MKILLILILVQFFSYASIAQETIKVDSLERALLSEEDPNKKMDIILELTDLILSSDPDRALDLAKKTVTYG